jgi:hypothetical protein
MTIQIIRCSSCDALIEEETDTNPENRKPCSNCGSASRKFGVEIAASVTLHDSLKVVLKSGVTGKTVTEGIAGDDLHRKSGKWMLKERLIDHEKDRYKEVVTDPETGVVIHHCEEPLSEHRDHGSAKRKTLKSVKNGK